MAIREKLPRWNEVRAALTEARLAEGRAKMDFEGMHERYELTMDRVHGRGVERYGRKKAERFFQRAPGRRARGGRRRRGAHQARLTV